MESLNLVVVLFCTRVYWSEVSFVGKCYDAQHTLDVRMGSAGVGPVYRNCLCKGSALGEAGEAVCKGSSLQ